MRAAREPLMKVYGKTMSQHYWLSTLTKKQIRRNSFGNANDVIKAINEFIAEYQKNPCPFVWTVDAGEILRKVARLQRLEATGQ